MNSYFWLVVLPNLGCFFGALGIIGITACIVGGLVCMTNKAYAYNEKDHANARKFAKTIFKFFSVSLISLFITCFIPSKTDIVQLEVISIVSELKGVDQIPQKLIDRLNYLLETEKS